MQELFVAIDEDGDGAISSEELWGFILMCLRLGRVTPELAELVKQKFDQAPVDGKGNVSKADGDAALAAVVTALLQKYDVDGNQQIDLQEFSKLYPMLRLSQGQ
eukprot:COSAG02_NODE_1699_length_11254_cov_13.904169_3_plen_104_part_00